MQKWAGFGRNEAIYCGFLRFFAFFWRKRELCRWASGDSASFKLRRNKFERISRILVFDEERCNQVYKYMHIY